MFVMKITVYEAINVNIYKDVVFFFKYNLKR